MGNIYLLVSKQINNWCKKHYISRAWWEADITHIMNIYLVTPNHSPGSLPFQNLHEKKGLQWLLQKESTWLKVQQNYRLSICTMYLENQHSMDANIIFIIRVKRKTCNISVNYNEITEAVLIILHICFNKISKARQIRNVNNFQLICASYHIELPLGINEL